MKLLDKFWKFYFTRRIDKSINNPSGFLQWLYNYTKDGSSENLYVAISAIALIICIFSFIYIIHYFTSLDSNIALLISYLLGLLLYCEVILLAFKLTKFRHIKDN